MSNEENRLQAKDVLKDKWWKLQATRDQCIALQKTMEYNKSMTLNGVWKWALMGEATFAIIEMECLKIENLIVVAK
jgi:hypothetical protein